MAPPRVFVSHSHLDNTFGLRLIADLRKRLGDDAVWYDQSGGEASLHPSEAFLNKIFSEITARDAFLVILSPQAMQSNWVSKEMEVAYFQHVTIGKALFPVLYQPCTVPPQWAVVETVDFVDADDQSYAAQLDRLIGGLLRASKQQHSDKSDADDTASDEAQTRFLELVPEQIHAAFGRSQWQNVMTLTSLMLANKPDSMTVELWRERGTAASELKDAKMAIDAFEHALKVEPRDFPTLRNLAQAQATAGQLPALSATVKGVLDTAPGVELHLKLELLSGVIETLGQRGNWIDALTYADRAQALAPDDASCQAQVVHVLEQLVRLKRQDKVWADALTYAKRLLSLTNDDAHWQAEVEQLYVKNQRSQRNSFALAFLGYAALVGALLGGFLGAGIGAERNAIGIVGSAPDGVVFPAVLKQVGIALLVCLGLVVAGSLFSLVYYAIDSRIKDAKFALAGWFSVIMIVATLGMCIFAPDIAIPAAVNAHLAQQITNDTFGAIYQNVIQGDIYGGLIGLCVGAGVFALPGGLVGWIIALFTWPVRPASRANKPAPKRGLRTAAEAQ